jgi:hypothetical protein
MVTFPLADVAWEAGAEAGADGVVTAEGAAATAGRDDGRQRAENDRAGRVHVR